MMKYTLILTLLTLLISCGTSPKETTDDPLLKEAAGYHMEAIEVEKEFKLLSKTLANQAAGIQVQGRALTDEEIKWLDSYQGLIRGYELWSENHIEVPGYEHAHDHSHDGHDHHHHHHGTDVQLTPQDMMETQKAFLDNINDLKTKAQQLLNPKSK